MLPASESNPLLQQARDALRRGDVDTAEQTARQMLAKNRKATDAHRLLAEILWHRRRYDDALATLRNAVQTSPKDPSLRRDFAERLRHAGRTREAITQFSKLLKQHPDKAVLVAGLARCFLAQGDSDKALQRVEPYLTVGNEPGPVAFVYVLAQVRRGAYDESIEVGLRHADSAEFNDDVRAEMLFAVALAFERRGDIDQAFEMYTRANALKRPSFSMDSFDRGMSLLREVFSADALSVLPRATIDTSRPVFIVGWPRCGSTLVERIIAAHPEATAAGETFALPRVIDTLPQTTGSSEPFPQAVNQLTVDHANALAGQYLDALKSIDARASRITDKYLSNASFLGVIELLLPQSRVIQVRRDPVDNCFACYTVPLGPGHPYSYDLHDIAMAYCAQDAVMQHWQKVLSLPMLTVQYEQLVTDPETWSRRIIEFCGLEWNDACLQFHAQQRGLSKSVLPTLSHDQVRRPIYQSSVQRAAPFEAHLGPLREALAEGRRKWSLDEP